MGSEQPQESRSSDNDRRQPGSPGGDPDDRRAPEGEDVADGTNDGGPSGARSAESPVSINELFELLSQPGNRYALAYLARTEGAVPYDDLVEYVVDTGGTPDGLSTADFRNQVATRLVHSNLPKLDDAGLIDYDKSDRTVRPTDATEVAVPYLELAMDQFSAE
ncbi:hypothetical protein ACFQMA_04195 [Halosimplex aquaticum]|uniref:DUF7344 domain-containing protein n=1 Tax=Halosimplex aquaticum TaxID=3026162 RepID=A0ABD5XV47_9EURY|nr:hypothetical protein [Halosimplex aquaticum]